MNILPGQNPCPLLMCVVPNGYSSLGLGLEFYVGVPQIGAVIALGARIFVASPGAWSLQD